MSATTTDIKPLVEKVERDLLDRPARRLVFWGTVLLCAGTAFGIKMEEIVGTRNGWYEESSLLIAFVGCVLIVSAIIVRILQRGRREEIRQEVERAHTGIETERARRDMRLIEMIEPIADMVRRNGMRIEATAEAADDIRNELVGAVKQARAAAYVDVLNGAGSVLPFARRRDGAGQDDRKP